MPKLVLLIALLLCSPLQAVPANKKTEILSREQNLIGMVNEQRTKQGLPALRHWKTLSDIARTHSENMASQTVAFGHGGFKERASQLKRTTPLSTFGENVAYSYGVKDPLTTAVNGWMKSPSHRDNILGKFEETGIGIAFATDGTCYITQLFATRFK